MDGNDAISVLSVYLSMWPQHTTHRTHLFISRYFPSFLISSSVVHFISCVCFPFKIPLFVRFIHFIWCLSSFTVFLQSLLFFRFARRSILAVLLC